MYCKGKVMYKGIEKREGGTFVNNNGQSIDYNSSYVVKFDEIIENKINERKLKFSTNNKKLFDKFNEISPYTPVDITCDVIMGSSVCRLEPIDVEIAEEEETK